MADCEISFNSIKAASSTTTPQQTGCFNCKRQGHWARDCPTKASKRSQPSTLSSSSTPSPTNYPEIDGSDLPIVRCPCGQGACRTLRAFTTKNYNRKFYTCPIPYNYPGNCGFFMWCDEVVKIRSPECKCGSGVCSLNKESTGANAGSWYFTCRIKKSQGACGFMQWLDPQSNLLMNRKVDNSTDSSCLQSPTCNPRVHTIMNDDSSKGEDLAVQVVNLSSKDATPEKVSLAITVVDEANDGELNVDVATQQAESFKPVSGVTLRSSFLTSKSEIHERQREFWRRIAAAGSTLNENMIRQILGLHFCGWLGRLAFPPCYGLKDPPMVPVLCCVFPSFDPIQGPESGGNADMEENSTHLLQSRSNDDDIATDVIFREIPIEEAHTSTVILREEPSGLKNAQIPFKMNPLSKSILCSFGLGLLDILKKMDPQDHPTMVNVAEATFDALRRLSVDFQSVHDIVMEYIHSQSKCASLGETMLGRVSLKELIDRQTIEKSRFEDVSLLEKEALAECDASDDKLQMLIEEEMRAKNAWLEKQQQLSCHEVENAKAHARAAEKSKETLEAKIRLEATSDELERAWELEAQRETAIRAANEAMESARLLLQQ